MRTTGRTRRGGRSGTATLGRLALAAALAVPSGSLFAQAPESGRIVVEGRGGVGFPLGELADIADVGPAFGAAGTYFFHRNLGVGIDLSATLLGSSAPDPFGVRRTSDVDLVHFGATLVFDASPPSHQDTPLSFRVALWNGLTSMSAKEGDLDFSETYYTVGGTSRIGYRIRPNLEIFAGTDVFVVALDDAETAVFFAGPNTSETFDLAISLPVTVGVTARLP